MGKKNAAVTWLTSSIIALSLASCIATKPVSAQTSTESDWVASPTFFAARSDSQRCAAIEVWLSSIREGGGGAARMNEMQSQNINRLAVPAFRGVFGKPFAEVSDDERKQIGKFLKKCSSELWVREMFAHAFTVPAEYPAAKSLARTFERYDVPGQVAPRRQGRMQKLPDPCALNPPSSPSPRNRPYATGELLLETSLFQLYGEQSYPGQCWCSNDTVQYGMGDASLSMVFKADERYEIKNDEAYWQRFDKEVLPLVFEKCGHVGNIIVNHHVAGFYINDKMEISDKETSLKEHYYSRPINYAIYRKRAGLGSMDLTKAGYARSWDDRGFSSVWGIREAPKVWEAERLARRAEEKRQAEVRRREYVERNRPENRQSAAAVLSLLSRAGKAAPVKYDFSGYAQREALQNIYSGDFEPFTGEYEPADILKAINPLNRDEPDALKFSRLMEIGRRRLPITIAYFAYHQVYGDVCRSSRDMPWVEARFRKVHTTTDWWGREIDRTEGQWFSYPVREHFAKAFMGAYEGANEGFLTHLLTGTSFTTKQVFERDFRKFLAAEGCSSPTVRHFEVNLYLASQWMLPLQELR